MKKYKWLLLGLVIGVCVFVFAYSFVLWKSVDKSMFSDSYGMLTALFAGLAFAGLIITIAIQKDEMRAQNETLAKQRFENTFFKMLEFLEVCIKDTIFERDTRFSEEIVRGRDAIIILCNVFYNKYLHWKEDDGLPINDDTILHFNKECKTKQGLSKVYLKFYGERGETLGQYYRILYNILKLVDNTSFTTKEKLIYTNLVRAKLSKYELLLIFYNCLSPLGEEKMAPLIKKYKILKHIDKSELPKEHLPIFKAFSKL